jgi:pimeloyl-ACP methyl ester carboxylesterase
MGMNSEIKNQKSAILLILPGWGGSNETWADFVALAKLHFQDVVVIDLPCFGTEPCPTDVWGVKEYANFVKKRINQFPNKQIILLGHSFGGAVATHLIAHNPELVDKLILSGAAVYRPKNYIRRILLGTFAKFGKVLFKIPFIEKGNVWAKSVLYKAADSPDYASTSGIKRDIFRKIIRQDLGYLLPLIAVPTCVIQGTRDTYVPYVYGARMAVHIPHASFVSVAGGTHGLHLKKKQELLDTILEFLTPPV